VTETIERNYLEIKSLDDLVESKIPKLGCSINLVKPNDFRINKFFYKNVGKNHRWTDRLVWSDKEWVAYSLNHKVDTLILKVSDDLAGYFELILHSDKKEVEIAYLGLLEEYHNKKLGSYLLSTAIKTSFQNINTQRVWVHTCTLDHKNALNNYLARGMKIYKTESVKI
jgi:hypothetical protein